MCHLVLALPVLGLIVFLILPLPIAAASYVVILGVSVALYWAVTNAMHQPLRNGIAALTGEEACVVEARGSECRVETHAEIWWAIASDSVRVGQEVRIAGAKGLKLEIEPLVKGKERRT